MSASLRPVRQLRASASYLATDGLDTVSEAVDSAGSVIAQQLYLPYGGSRYNNGTMPMSKGYTGQRADAATGLDYYGARYYDPVLGQFTSADDVLPGNGLDPWGLSRYAYVEGNPIARNDPTGHITVGVCTGGSAGAGAGGFVDGCIVVGWSATDGWSGGLTGTAGGDGFGGIDAGWGAGLQISNANTVDDLGGWFGYVGGGGKAGVGFDGTGFGGKDSKGRAVWGAEGQVSAGGGVHVYGGASFTKVWDFNTIGSGVKGLTLALVNTSRSAADQTVKSTNAWVNQQVDNGSTWVNQQVDNANQFLTGLFG